MKSITIIISHFETPQFLRACIRQIRKFRHPEIEQEIIICEQSGDKIYGEVCDEYPGDDDVSVVKTASLYSGYGTDYALRYMDIKSEYICSLHVDAFPISKNWLMMPIKLIEENRFYFVGQLHFINSNADEVYPPGKPFFSMSPTFNVARTDTYREMAMEGGFTRFHNRLFAENGMEWNNNDWVEWASVNYKARGSDDDVPAFRWEDNYRDHDKLGLAIIGYIEGSYGRIIEDVVFHFGSCREALGVLNQMPKLYNHYYNKINENYSDELIDEMVEKAKANRPPAQEILSRNFWDGKLKESSAPSIELMKRIEELKFL